MPYDTRRKSLSLPSLGITLPTTHAARALANRSPPAASPSSEQPPAKKVKRSHSSTSPTPMSPPAKSALAKPNIKYEHTPPPSPEPENAAAKTERKAIDLEGINDEIVVAVIIQLEKTGNRPHLVKELAAILSSQVKIVETSANPSAIISSRLATYLKRPCWSALAPCPIAKELETVHPRRTYFYLTTYPHQPIPDPAQASAAADAMRYIKRAIISPSLSSAESRSDEADAERRRELSPSPEVDLSTPEFDEAEDDDLVTPPTPTGSFSGRIPHHEVAASALQNHRAASPPLEKDEKEFTQTAQGMRKRRSSNDEAPAKSEFGQPSSAVPEIDFSSAKFEGDFFGDHSRNPMAHTGFASSPAMKPVGTTTSLLGKRGFESLTDSWASHSMVWDSRSPESIELDELDGMLSGF